MRMIAGKLSEGHSASLVCSTLGLPHWEVFFCRIVHVICRGSHGFGVRISLNLGSCRRRPHHHTNPDHTAMTQQLFDEKPVFRPGLEGINLPERLIVMVL